MYYLGEHQEFGAAPNFFILIIYMLSKKSSETNSEIAGFVFLFLKNCQVHFSFYEWEGTCGRNSI